VLVVLILALLVASLDVARLLTYRDEPARRAAPVSPVSIPVVEPPAPTASTPSTVVTGGASRPPARNASASVSAGATVVEPAPTPPAAPITTLPTAVVTCASDLELADAPDAPYNFLCVQDGVPVTWPSDSIRLFSSGLTPEQTSALQVALPQWEQQGRFSVTVVDSASTANVTIGPGELDNGEDGHTLAHYVCVATCAFDRVEIELSSTRELTKPVWITTILHELGHAAGLNHVSRHTQVMYPELDLLSPAVYADGDLAGLEELARVRGS
jgi:hypothetical protein